jgi:hypothetical protein
MVRTVVIRVVETASDPGYNNVVIYLGLTNTGSEVGSTPDTWGLVPTLEVAEGRSYEATVNGIIHDVVPVPPGTTVCGSGQGAFHVGFLHVPAAAHPSKLDIPGNGKTGITEVDLTAPLGSCPAPVVGDQTSFESVPASGADPGFSVSVTGPMVSFQDTDTEASQGYKVPITVANKSTLDTLALAPGSGPDGIGGIWAVTDRSYLTSRRPLYRNDCDDNLDVGPGQTRKIAMCFVTGEGNGPRDTGTPIALLVVSASGAYGLAKLPAPTSGGPAVVKTVTVGKETTSDWGSETLTKIEVLETGEIRLSLLWHADKGVILYIGSGTFLATSGGQRIAPTSWGIGEQAPREVGPYQLEDLSAGDDVTVWVLFPATSSASGPFTYHSGDDVIGGLSW